MRKARRTAMLVVGVLIASLLPTLFTSTAPASAAAQGGTDAAASGTTVTITVRLDLCCSSDDFGYEASHAAFEQYITKAQDAWNDALAKLPYKRCYSIHAAFMFHLLRDGQDYEAGYHHIHFNWDFPGRTASFDPGTQDPTEDTTTAYKQGLNGNYYPRDLSVRDWEHEIGHLMGLGDDYVEVHGHAVAHSGRPEDTLMAFGSRIDKVLADRLGDLVARSGVKLPQCWSGAIHSTSSAELPGFPDTNCHETWDTTFAVAVDPNGDVIGTGNGTRVAVGCVNPRYAQGEATYQVFRIKGRFDGRDFTLTFAQTATDGGTAGLFNYALFIPPQPVLKASVTSPGMARGTTPVSRQLANRSIVTANHDVSMTCENSC